MTARRRAKAGHEPPSTGPGGVPAALLVGRCIEVWGDPASEARPDCSAFTRFSRARTWWLQSAGIDRPEDQDRLVPGAPIPWSALYLLERSRTEAAGQQLADLVHGRLSAAGATLANLDDLRAEAVQLHEMAVDAGPRKHKRMR